MEDTIQLVSRKFSFLLTTGFGLEGCALIDMFSPRPLRVWSVDTEFLFPETHEHIARMKDRYTNVHWSTSLPMSEMEQSKLWGDELWKRNPDACCRIRKVDPLRRALHDEGVWVTAITRDQGRDCRAFQWIEKYQVLRVCPLWDWTRGRVWDYVRSHNVPFNPLHLQGYPTIGCTHCTKPVGGLNYDRAGRWQGFDKTECGIHDG